MTEPSLVGGALSQGLLVPYTFSSEAVFRAAVTEL
jgi:hypothetical protein